MLYERLMHQERNNTISNTLRCKYYHKEKWEADWDYEDNDSDEEHNRENAPVDPKDVSLHFSESMSDEGEIDQLSERKKVESSMIKQDSFDFEADNFLLTTRRDARSPTQTVSKSVVNIPKKI